MLRLPGRAGQLLREMVDPLGYGPLVPGSGAAENLSDRYPAPWSHPADHPGDEGAVAGRGRQIVLAG